MRRAIAVVLSTAAAFTFMVLPARPAAAALADVSITVASLPTAVPVGGAVTYRLTVKNLGVLPTVAITVNDSQSGGTITGASAGCTFSAGSATCTAGALNSGGTKVFDIAVTAPNTGGTISNSASVSALFVPTAIDGAPGNNASGASTQVTVGDVKITGQSIPATVSTDEDAIYRLTATNVGGIPASSVTINASQSGAAFDAAAPVSAGCSYPTSTTATCALGALAPGASKTVDIVARAPLTTGSMTNNSTVSAVFSPATSDANPSNNSASVTTPVTDPAPGTFGYIPPGQSMSYQQSVMTVPTSGTRGIIADMSTAVVAPGTMCGVFECNNTNPLHVGILQDPNYAVTDPAKPLTLDISFGQGDPCRGLGNSCTELYWRHDASQAPQKMPSCLIAGRASPAPCLSSKYKVNGDVHYVVKALSTDPDYLAPLRTLVKL